ncbi:DUF1059 domain-containing protein [Sulfuracidifex metallicus]|jgi:predicted small metal-binding protein|uniref:DUF1059 domain-containing protein n=1 Tax=Sulfuracidifex metallicus DSM 6482 = JCM 9184 TaxID=523847 RepID=A0A6A9QR89_SULME|nr:DUF1059 domain-containing protein [Sulfuracidifex metallicus]MUN29701.1 DUF1059 domain-containing protein [Sulfuracidifex metallicus DSM 6482 = JCM 9184]WOE49791.1 DUF1059 domain-containing protein [Sulfuracidifex metallicus DSM 6482 = JCM 9184]
MQLFGKKKKYYFSCSSVGMSCGFEVKGASSEAELMDILKIHAAKAHGMTTIPDSTVDAIKKNIEKK